MVVCAASHGVTVSDLGDDGLRGTEAGVLSQETNICRHMASRSGEITRLAEVDSSPASGPRSFVIIWFKSRSRTRQDGI